VETWPSCSAVPKRPCLRLSRNRLLRQAEGGYAGDSAPPAPARASHRRCALFRRLRRLLELSSLAGLAYIDFRSDPLAPRTPASTSHHVLASSKAHFRLPRAGDEPDLGFLVFPRLGKRVFWNSAVLPSVGKGKFWDFSGFPRVGKRIFCDFLPIRPPWRTLSGASLGCAFRAPVSQRTPNLPSQTPERPGLFPLGASSVGSSLGQDALPSLRPCVEQERDGNRPDDRG